MPADKRAGSLESFGFNKQAKQSESEHATDDEKGLDTEAIRLYTEKVNASQAQAEKVLAQKQSDRQTKQKATAEKKAKNLKWTPAWFTQFPWLVKV
jgi:hypothetical protein